MDSNNKKPFVSVVVPVYNVERYIKQCVDSIIHQTLRNIEIILVDDGSPDNCPAICDAYAKEDSRVKVIHQPNGGYGKACNAGFAAATGEYLGIIESDDYAELDMFEKLYGLAKAFNLEVARCHYFFYNSLYNIHNRVEIPQLVPRNTIYSPIERYYTFYQQPSVWANIYRTDYIRKNNIRFLETPGASYQDTSFSFKIYACAKRFMLLDDTLIHYRIDNENSSINSKAKIFCICDEFAEIERFVNEDRSDVILNYFIPRKKFGHYMWNYRRLNKKNRLAFLKVFSREMRQHIAKKTVRKEFVTKKERLKMYLVAYFYPLFFILYAMKSILKDS